jgi:hypothetical protein
MDRRGSDFSCDFALQQALEFFQRKHLEASVEEMQDLLDAGDLEGMKEKLTTTNPLEFEDLKVESTNVLTDADTIRKGFEDASDPLIYFPNALGNFINGLFTRKSFVGILAPEKTGKTWLLNAIGLQGLKAKKNVAIFNCGDLDNEEQAVRFGITLSRRSNLAEHCGEFYTPVLDCRWNQENSCNREVRTSKVGTAGIEVVEPEDIELAHPDYVACRKCCGEKHYKGAAWYKKLNIETPLTWREALVANEKFLDSRNITADALRMRSYPSDTFSVEQAERLLEQWALEDGWTADIVLFDYLDVMATDKSLIGTRHGENHKWKRARGLAQKFNALVVTPTQADGNSYDQESLTEKNYSEDKRKYSHVTGFLALNQTAEDAVLMKIRIGRFMTRNMKKTKAQVTVLQSIQRGLVHVGSFFNYP